MSALLFSELNDNEQLVTASESYASCDSIFSIYGNDTARFTFEAFYPNISFDELELIIQTPHYEDYKHTSTNMYYERIPVTGEWMQVDNSVVDQHLDYKQRPSKESLFSKKLEALHFTLFYANWCPQSLQFMQLWNQCKEKYPNISFSEYDCTDETNLIPKLLDEYKVSCYPTLLVKHIYNNQTYEFDVNVCSCSDAEAFAYTLAQFINNIMSFKAKPRAFTAIANAIENSTTVNEETNELNEETNELNEAFKLIIDTNDKTAYNAVAKKSFETKFPSMRYHQLTEIGSPNNDLSVYQYNQPVPQLYFTYCKSTNEWNSLSELEAASLFFHNKYGFLNRITLTHIGRELVAKYKFDYDGTNKVVPKHII